MTISPPGPAAELAAKPPAGHALLIVGATSGAGKSTVTAALGRVLANRYGPEGSTVAPFKAQNMSNHAAVTADGGEIGRAQATQASACGVDFDRRMNPVLLKPTSELRSHLVVMGDEVMLTDAHAYGPSATDLKPVVLDALQSLRQEFDWVVAEGAGGAAEINMLDRDLVNLPLARAAGLKSILVVDIDRGGAFAAAFGTIELVPPELRATIGGVLFNQFRGDPRLLAEGIKAFEARTGVPILGVLPAMTPAPTLGAEDSLDITTGAIQSQIEPGRPPSCKPVRVAAVRLPNLANPSDLDSLTIEPDLLLRWAVRPEDLSEADLIILPGSRATVQDLNWLRQSGMADALAGLATSKRQPTVIGVCGGYQMLGHSITDNLESGQGRVDGLGLLDVATTFAAPKMVCRSRGRIRDGVGDTEQGDGSDTLVSGYQIRWGRPEGAASPWLTIDGEPEGAVVKTSGATFLGTSLHGVFDDDGFRARLLAQIADRSDRVYRPGSVGFTEAMQAQHNRLAAWLEVNSDIDRLVALASMAEPPSQAPGW